LKKISVPQVVSLAIKKIKPIADLKKINISAKAQEISI